MSTRVWREDTVVRYDYIRSMTPDWDFNEFVSMLPKEGNLLEIGSFLGRSAICWAETFESHNKDWNIHTVDMFRGIEVKKTLDDEMDWYMKNFVISEEEHLEEFKKNIDGWDNITWEKEWIGTTIEVADYNPPVEPTALFYDADHRYIVLNKVLERFKEVPFMFIDDYGKDFKGTIRSVDEFVGQTGRQFFIREHQGRRGAIAVII